MLGNYVSTYIGNYLPTEAYYEVAFFLIIMSTLPENVAKVCDVAVENIAKFMGIEG